MVFILLEFIVHLIHALTIQQLLDIDRLQDILAEFKERHARNPETQLLALLENTEYYLSTSMISMLPFGSGRFLFNTMWVDG